MGFSNKTLPEVKTLGRRLTMLDEHFLSLAQNAYICFRSYKLRAHDMIVSFSKIIQSDDKADDPPTLTIMSCHSTIACLDLGVTI